MTTATSKAPRIFGPRDVPRLRDYLYGEWSSGALHYPQVEQAVVDGQVLERTKMATGEWERPNLAAASLWYVTGEMCDVLAAAERQLPSETALTAELVPHPSGLVVFEAPMSGVDSMTGEPTMRIDAILWGPVNVILASETRPAVGIASYRRLRLEDGMGPDDLQAAAAVGGLERLLTDIDRVVSGATTMLSGDLWLPCGRSDWVLGERLDHQHGPMTDETLASMVEDRQRLASLWLLTGQDDIAETVEDHGTRQDRRRADREGKARPTVRVVTIRSARRSAVGRESTEESQRRPLKVRSLVSGFWRRRPYHPSCQDCTTGRHGCGGHPPKWVHAFWRGPDDGPISNIDKVRVWRAVAQESTVSAERAVTARHERQE